MKKVFFPSNIEGDLKGESMWVEVESIKDGVLTGRLRNNPVTVNYKFGDTITATKKKLPHLRWVVQQTPN